MLLGPGYWRGFRAQYYHRFVSKKEVQFGHNRSKWCKYKNFVKMYDLVYEATEIAKIAKKLPEAGWQNEKGEKVSNREEAVGEKVEYDLTHPDYILYVDEVGNNTCQKEDGSKGDQNMLVRRGSEAKTACSTPNDHWMTLGFTADNGEPVLCVIIFASEILSVEERLGVDMNAPSPQDDDVIFSRDCYDPGKYFTGGPRCNFVPCFVTCSSKCSITSQILADAQHRSFYLMGMDLAWRCYSYNTSMIQGTSGLYALDVPMGRLYGRLEILLNKTGLLKCTAVR